MERIEIVWLYCKLYGATASAFTLLGCTLLACWLASRSDRHRCPICLIPIAERLHFCCRCGDVVADLRWRRSLRGNWTAEGREEV